MKYIVISENSDLIFSFTELTSPSVTDIGKRDVVAVSEESLAILHEWENIHDGYQNTLRDLLEQREMQREAEEWESTMDQEGRITVRYLPRPDVEVTMKKLPGISYEDTVESIKNTIKAQLKKAGPPSGREGRDEPERTNI